MTTKVDEKDELISDVPKDGLITATGVILAFVLGFFVNFSSADHPWRAIDIIPIATLAVAILILALTLYRTFIPYKQTIRHFETSVRLLMLGICLSLLGAVIGLFV